jgi:hypothetical protein
VFIPSIREARLASLPRSRIRGRYKWPYGLRFDPSYDKRDQAEFQTRAADPAGATALKPKISAVSFMMLTLFALAALHLTPSGRSPYRGPQLATSSKLVVLAFGAGHSIFVTTSNDQGTNFVSPVKVVEADVLPLGRHRGPRVVLTKEASGAGASGNLPPESLFDAPCFRLIYKQHASMLAHSASQDKALSQTMSILRVVPTLG